MITEQALYVDVILPLPLPQLFTYSVPENLKELTITGKRVVIQFGGKKVYTAIIASIHNKKPEHYQTKDIISVLDDQPIVNELQFQFWNWISQYYQCAPGEVMKAALPSGLKLESETKILFNSEFKADGFLSEKEELVMNILSTKNIITINELSSIIEQKQTLPIIKSLLDKKAIFIEERLKDNYKPKTEIFVEITAEYNNENSLNQLLNKLSKAKAQHNLVVSYLMISKLFSASEQLRISKKELLEKSETNSVILSSLIKKNVFTAIEVEVGRLNTSNIAISDSNQLNEYQQKTHKEINAIFETKDVVLLHGVTSSGKTEIYIQLITECIAKGKQALYLLPEIALTTQIINRLTDVFGNKVGVYHSKFSDSERVEIYNNIGQDANNYQVILGVRSSVFLPFNNLGLIIIDEEHENTYKQYDPAPRYNARDAAIVLAKLHGAKTLLGTATPSIESYYNASHGKYGLVELFNRYQDIKMPEIITVNTRDARRRKLMRSLFSDVLVNHIEEALAKKEQVILFQNRRGFSPFLECEACGWIPKCNHCDVSMTYHKHINQLVCHYCGFSYSVPSHCKACGSQAIQTKGFGTEKIEDEIAILFPDAKIARMDLDTTRTKKSYLQIISDFETKQVDILIGTQMISKGLDFDNVSIVGIMNAENMLNFPDFRAFERSFQLMTQVSGRAGRKNKQGKVIIQTSDPDHPVIKNIIENDYLSLYNTQLQERKKFKYPPFYRLIEITLKHKHPDILKNISLSLAKELRAIFGDNVLGPEPPIVSRIQNWHLMEFIIKIEREKSFAVAKQYIHQAVEKTCVKLDLKNLQVVIDVDPM